MPLIVDQELLEHELRVRQMQTNIGKMEADLKLEDHKLRRQTATIFVQMLAGSAALLGAGVALGNYLARNSSPVPPPSPQIIYIVPGQAPPTPPRAP